MFAFWFWALYEKQIFSQFTFSIIVFTKYFVCIFPIDESTPMFDPEGFKKEYGEGIKKESDAACDDRICIESDDVEYLQTWFINDFSIYDNNNHLLPLDSGLIGKSKVVHKISGIVSGIFENPVTVPILDAGKITWW